MSLYNRGGVYHYDFIIRGRRYRGSTKQNTRRRAELVEAKIKTEVLEGMAPDRKAPKLADFGEPFLKWVDENQRFDTDTRRYYKNGWRLLKDTKLVNMRLSEITNDDVAALGPQGNPPSVNNAIRTLRRIMSKAAEKGYIRTAPKLALVEEHSREAVIDEATEAEILAKAAQPLRDVFLLIMDSGMRPEEIFRLRWENIDWLNSTIFVPYGKTKDSRRLAPLTARARAALMMRNDGQKAGWVFPSAKAKCGHIVNVAKQWMAVRDALGLNPNLVLYSARHSFGTRVYSETGNLKLIMKVMGHKDVKTAMRYQHPEVELARLAIEGASQIPPQ